MGIRLLSIHNNNINNNLKLKFKIMSSMKKNIALFFIIFGLGSLIYFFTSKKSDAAVTATFALSPASGNYQVGDTFNVNIALNTSGNATDAAQVKYINYDPSILEVQDASSSQAGVQIQAGSLYANTLVNSVSGGKITLEQTTSGGTNYSGSGTFGTITFRVLAAGTANVTIDFTAGSTTITYVTGEDGGEIVNILSSVNTGSFTLTQPVDSTAPTISSVSSSGVTTSGATITWTTSEASTSQIEYGTTANYGSSTALDSTQVTSHSVSLSGLSESITYHYRVKSQDAAGNLATSGDYTFTTTTSPDTTAPTISGVTVNAKDQSAAVIIWTTNEASTSQVEYGASTSYGSSTTIDSNKVTSHQVSIGGLNASATYHYRVKSQDAAGNLAISGDNTFTTDSLPPPDTTPPVISNVRVIAKDSSAAVIAWDTNEMSTSQAEYGLSTSYGSGTATDNNRVLQHQVSIGGLNASTTYYYRVVSKDASGNEAKSDSATFSTEAAGSSPTTPSNPVPADTTAPAAIKDLSVSDAGDTSAILSWTAVGDDSQTGTAVSYEIRYSTSTITSKNWSKANKVNDVIKPSKSGVMEKNLVSGLKPKTKYYFAIKVSDEAPNVSDLSNVVLATTKEAGIADNIAPAKVENFSAIAGDPGDNKITFNWINPQDGDFIKGVIIRKEGSEPASISDGQIVYEGSGTSFTDTNVIPGITYYYKIFAADEVPNYSEGVVSIAVVKELLVVDTIPPKPVSNFKAKKEDGQIVVSWINPFDSDFAEVTVRKKLESTSKNEKDGELVYKGQGQSFADFNVQKGQTYYYSIFASDTKLNYSKPASIVITMESSNLGAILGIILVLLLAIGGFGYWWIIYKGKGRPGGGSENNIKDSANGENGKATSDSSMGL